MQKTVYSWMGSPERDEWTWCVYVWVCVGVGVCGWVHVSEKWCIDEIATRGRNRLILTVDGRG
jgi:hypothetical protein